MTLKRWLLVGTFGALALIIYLAWHDIIRAFYRLDSLNIWVLLLMVPMLFLFYFSLGKFFESFFAALGTKVRQSTLFTTMLELNFVNHVFPSGGISGFSYLTIRLKPYGISTAKATIAQMGRFGFAFVSHISLMFISLFLLAVEGHTSSLIVLLVSMFVFSLLAVAVVGLFVISNEQRCINFARRFVGLINHVVHIVRRKHPETLSLSKAEVTFVELHADYMQMRQNLGKMRQSFFWVTAASILEIALLYVVFVAHGVWVNPGAVIIAFVIANTAGLIVALPGGIGVFEALMTTVFIAVGVEPGLALSVTVVYRVIILLLSLVTGAAFYQRAINKIGSDGTADIHS